jgi:hypothetical protein
VVDIVECILRVLPRTAFVTRDASLTILDAPLSDSPPSAPPISNTSYDHAVRQLLESERKYVQDLELLKVRNIGRVLKYPD